MNQKKFYITTTLPYVNAAPHIGFALETVHADVLARFARLLGNEVVFNTGTDEHGMKIYQKALEEKKDVQAYVDEYAAKFDRLKSALNLSYTNFIRTTDAHHIAAAQEFWKLCDAHGDIYKKKYKGLYCIGDEMFLKEGDLVDGKCPNHPSLVPVEIEEENYFFRLSKYQDKLLEYLSRADCIVPSWRREEAINFVTRGLEDFSISRETTRMSWGIPVPNDAHQVMYVWFDALTNYISTLGWPNSARFNEFWEQGVTCQLAGKDQIRFQSIMWQAMLMSAKLPTTQHVIYHGFITSGGQKMSKSVGNVIDPFVVVEKYGTDALRYWLTREMNTFEDGDFTWEKFAESYNGGLANGLGNLVSRIMKMASTNSVSVAREMNVATDDEFAAFREHLAKYEIKKAADEIWKLIGELDKKIQDTEPFRLVKTDPEKAKEIIAELMNELWKIAYMVEPFLPETGEKIFTALKNPSIPLTPLFPRI